MFSRRTRRADFREAPPGPGRAAAIPGVGASPPPAEAGPGRAEEQALTRRLAGAARVRDEAPAQLGAGLTHLPACATLAAPRRQADEAMARALSDEQRAKRQAVRAEESGTARAGVVAAAM